MVRPVLVSRMPGATGARSERRTSAKLVAFCGSVFACEARTERACELRRVRDRDVREALRAARER
jgi:hypothetical protein